MLSKEKVLGRRTARSILRGRGALGSGVGLGFHRELVPREVGDRWEMDWSSQTNGCGMWAGAAGEDT